MNFQTSRATTLAALVAAALLAACGGNDGDENNSAAPPAAGSPPTAPAASSALQPSGYYIARHADGTPFIGGGGVTDRTASGGTLSLGNQGQTVLTVNTANNGFDVTSPDFYVVSRYAGGVLMLCDPTTEPGTTPTRFIAVSGVADAGGPVAAPVSRAAHLAGQRFYKMSACVYQSKEGSQGQNRAADADTLSLDFDSSGNASSTAFAPVYTAAQVNALLSGVVSVNSVRWSAFTLVIGGTPKTVIIDRDDYDAANNAGGALRLWLQE